MKIAAQHNQRILIVDDDEDIRRALIDSLMLRGYHCVAADHGESALRYLDTDRFHLVITDYRMPIMDGIQLLEALKKHPTHDRPPVILPTADMSKESRRQALELGAYAVIDELIAFQELAVLSARAIEGREVDRSGLSETRDD